MFRRLHGLFGLGLGLVVSFMAVTGAVISIQPALETAAAPPVAAGESVADLAGKVSAALPGLERIVRSASGQVVAYFLADGRHDAALVDPASGAVVGPYAPSAFFSFFIELHRSLFLGDGGRIVAGLSALALAVLALSGLALLVKRLGGFRRLFDRTRGTFPERFHAALSRLAVIVLTISALSGVYMSLRTFSVIPDGQSDLFVIPAAGSGGPAAPLDTLAGLKDIEVSSLREVALPPNGDTADVISVKTASGERSVDLSTGAVVSETPLEGWARIYELIYLLHTGQGAWWLGLLLGLGALSVPVLGVTGFLVYGKRQGQRPRFSANVVAHAADLVVLVGSEGQSSWGFATHFAEQMTRLGHKVHLSEMNRVRPRYSRANLLVVMAATYGAGDAPASARDFLKKLARMPASPVPRIAVLGFGDRSFPRFCAYAEAVEAALVAKGADAIVPLFPIDRQSPQAFAQWGRALGERMGQPLSLNHTPKHPRTRRFTLVNRLDYGVDVQAPTVILTFRPTDGKKLHGFEVGDLIGIRPPGSPTARYYSLASRARDGVVEIAVRKRAGGACSTYLHSLAIGSEIDGFFKSNPDFRPQPSRKPLILIGAGTGVAPLAGLVRANRSKRPIHVFFGGRDPASDFLYKTAFDAGYQEGRLATLTTVFSRVGSGGYVQDRVRAAGDVLAEMIGRGASVVVCGGLNMAQGVREALDEALGPVGLDVATLKEKGRYVEDAY